MANPQAGITLDVGTVPTAQEAAAAGASVPNGTSSSPQFWELQTQVLKNQGEQIKRELREEVAATQTQLNTVLKHQIDSFRRELTSQIEQSQMAVFDPLNEQLEGVGIKGGLTELLAHMVEETGNHKAAAAIRRKEFDNTFMANVHRTVSHKITVGDVLIAALGLAAATIVWEAVATKFDLPRFGLFDPSAMKAIKK